MKLNRLVRVLQTSILAGLLTCTGLSAAATAAPPSAPAAVDAISVARDPIPQPPWVFSGFRFDSESPCRATGRAYVLSGRYSAWTCRYSYGSYRLYLLPR